MKLFNAHIAETGEELCVVARTMDHAAEVLVTFWLARTGDAPGAFDVGHGSPRGYGDHDVVRSAAAGFAAGVVVRQLDGSMLFEPAIG